MAGRSRQGNNDRFAGLALAGGRSSRFGSDKAAATLAGRPLLDWVVSALSESCDHVAVSAGRDGEAAALAQARGLTVVADDPRHQRGPLAGVAAGLAWASGAGFERLITLPCDTPLVGRPQIAALLAALGDAPAAYAVTADGPQPLCAVWRADLVTMLSLRLTLGRHPAVRAFFGDIEAVEVRFDDPRPFTNANSPAVLATLASWMET